jgi:hypothetical protein
MPGKALVVDANIPVRAVLVECVRAFGEGRELVPQNSVLSQSPNLEDVRIPAIHSEANSSISDSGPEFGNGLAAHGSLPDTGRGLRPDF